MLEYVAVGLGVIAGIASVTAFVYRRGVNSGFDSACETRIKDEVKAVGVKVDKHIEHDDKIHAKLFDEIKEVKDLLIQTLVTKGN